MGKSSGLRNKSRPNGKSTYTRKGKGNKRDTYGSWENGKQVRPDNIAGRILDIYKERERAR